MFEKDQKSKTMQSTIEDIITNHPLARTSYYDEAVQKTAIVLHHTAGASNPVNVIDGWGADLAPDGTPLRVATAFVIGRRSSSVGSTDAQFDGSIYRAFQEDRWAHHLGTRNANNKILNVRSIGIEICNYGGLRRTATGRYLSYVNREVDPSQVIDLGFEWRGFRYWEDYTSMQLVALRTLVNDLCQRFGVTKKPRRSVDASWFGLDADALAGAPGIWTHANYREDKTDCYPHPKLINMLNSLA